MAAPCRSFIRSTIGAGLQFLSSTNGMQSSIPRQCVFQHRTLHHSTCSLLHRTEGHMTEGKKAEVNTEEDSGPEYIPKRRKAKNPMKAVGYAWIIGLPAGIIGFILVKREVDRNRLKQLKVRLRMQKSNEGEYQRERYKSTAGEQ